MHMINRPQKRLIGFYYWCAYWKQWDLILAIKHDFMWEVVQVDQRTLKPIGEKRVHCTPLNGRHIASKPFNVHHPLKKTGVLICIN